MDFNKLKGLVPVKKANINRDLTNRTKSKTSNMTPHAIKCEVFFYDNKFYGIVDNERYPIDITDEDYQKATFAFSTPENGVGKLDMERINNRNEKVFKRLSPKYYASRRN